MIALKVQFNQQVVYYHPNNRYACHIYGEGVVIRLIMAFISATEISVKYSMSSTVFFRVEKFILKTSFIYLL